MRKKCWLLTKKTKTKRNVLHLKESLSLDNSRSYIVGRAIKAEDLERKFSSFSSKSSKLVTGRQLHTYAKNAMTNYRKALAYSKHVSNMDICSDKDVRRRDEKEKITRIEILQHKKKKKMLRSSKLFLLIIMK